MYTNNNNAFQFIDMIKNQSNPQELGEVIDMIKDLEKSMYYEAIVTAMENDGGNKHIKWIKDEEELDHTSMHKKDHSE